MEQFRKRNKTGTFPENLQGTTIEGGVTLISISISIISNCKLGIILCAVQENTKLKVLNVQTQDHILFIPQPSKRLNSFFDSPGRYPSKQCCV